MSSLEARREMKRMYGFDETGPHDAEKIRAEQAIAYFVADELLRHYPGHPWQVDCTLYTMHRGEKLPGAIQIKLPVIMPEGKSYNIPLRMLRDHNTICALIKRAGGELLERYRLPRSGCSFDHLLAVRPRARLDHTHRVPD